jgi:TolB protein
VRGYFHLGGRELSWANWMEAMLAGRGFVTNGPLIEFTANGQMPGTEIALPAGGGSRHVRGHGELRRAARPVELVSMGEVVHTATLAETGSSAPSPSSAAGHESGWYSVRAMGPERTFPVENTRPLAVTNPVYVPSAGSRFAIARRPSTS